MSGAPLTPSTEPIYIDPQNLFTDSLVTSSHLYPLQNIEWQRIVYINWSSTLIGAWFGLVISTIPSILLKYFSNKPFPIRKAVILLSIELIIGIITTVIGYVKDIKRRKTIKKISGFFDKNEIG